MKNIYSPKIKADLIPLLYWLKLRLDMPMTEIVDEILRPELYEMEDIFLKEEQEVTYESRTTGKRLPRRND